VAFSSRRYHFASKAALRAKCSDFGRTFGRLDVLAVESSSFRARMRAVAVIHTDMTLAVLRRASGPAAGSSPKSARPNSLTPFAPASTMASSRTET
jgi:hypothetical protein